MRKGKDGGKECGKGRMEGKSAERGGFVCLCWGLTSQSTIFLSCRDGATASWVIYQYFRRVKCLAQGQNTAAVGFEPTLRERMRKGEDGGKECRKGRTEGKSAERGGRRERVQKGEDGGKECGKGRTEGGRLKARLHNETLLYTTWKMYHDWPCSLH